MPLSFCDPIISVSCFSPLISCVYISFVVVVVLFLSLFFVVVVISVEKNIQKRGKLVDFDFLF